MLKGFLCLIFFFFVDIQGEERRAQSESLLLYLVPCVVICFLFCILSVYKTSCLVVGLTDAGHVSV